MRKSTWHSLVAVLLLLCAVPVDCHAGEQIVVPVATAQAVVSAPSDTPAEAGCVCQEDCFCCTLVVPRPVFELPHARTRESLSTDSEPGNPVERSTAVYHPPRV